MISPVILPTTYLSGVTSPLTTAEPSPQLASTTTTERSPVLGLRVNITPEQRESIMRWITTPIASPCSGSFNRRRYITDSTAYRLAQHLRTCSITESTPRTHRYVSCSPAKLASALSSLVALERMATGSLSPELRDSSRSSS